MKTMIRMIAATAAVLVAAHGLMGQIPAGAPAGSMGQCKDGTYSTAPSRQGACGGHKGVKDWYAPVAAVGASRPAATAATVAPAAVAAPVPATTTPAARPAPTAATAPVASKPAPTAGKLGPAAAAAARTEASGGGPGMVWVNVDSKVYHCPGSTFYGKTKNGKYMAEADAKAMGAHGDRGKTCSK